MTQVRGRISRLEKLIGKRGSKRERAWWGLAFVCSLGFNDPDPGTRVARDAFDAEMALETVGKDGADLVMTTWDTLQRHAVTPQDSHDEMRWWLGEYSSLLQLPPGLATGLELLSDLASTHRGGIR